jgi:capsular exopolysaccharide synthesis family protein
VPAESASESSDTGAGAGSIDVAALALRGKWWLLLGLIAGLIGGELAYLKLGPMYEAKARVLVSKRAAPAIKNDDSAAGGAGDRGEHVALIMSPLIVGEAVRKHQLDRLPSLQGDPEAVETILGKLKVKRSAGQDSSVLNVLDLTYISNRPKDAERIVQAVIEAYKDYLEVSRDEHNVETLKLIDDSSRDLLKQLKEKEQAYIAFREQAPLLWNSVPGAEENGLGSTNVHQERLMAVEADRRLNLLKRAEISSKIQALEEAVARGESRAALEVLVRRFMAAEGGAAANPTLAAAVDPAVKSDSVQSQLLPLILEEERLSRDFGKDHPQVRAARESLRTMVDFYRRQGVPLPEIPGLVAKTAPGEQPAAAPTIDFVEVYIASLHQQRTELELRDKELGRLFEESGRDAKRLARYQFEDQASNAEIRRLKGLWDAVVTRLNEMNLIKDPGGYALKQIAPAREELLLKRQIQLVGIFTLLGLGAAFGLLYFKALQDTTFKTVEELRQQFGFPVMGQVPAFNPADLLALAQNRSALDPTLYYVHRPGSSEAEAYRGLRTALYFSIHGESHRVLQVTSPEPQDGKTTLAANLAVAIANSGKRVLLIDADLRCPKVHTLFGVLQEIGLADVLEGEIELPNAVRETEVAGLSLLCAGLNPANPAELLGAAEFTQLLAEARKAYDFVIVDTPPLLAVSDPCIVAPQTDGLLLVLRLGKNKRTAVKQASHLLATNGISLLGVVVNGVEPSREYGYGYGYTDDSRPTPQRVKSLPPVTPPLTTASV